MNSLLLIPIIILASLTSDALWDKYRFDYLHRHINHTKDYLIWFLMTMLVVHLGWMNIFVSLAGATLYSGSRLLFFDPILNISRGKAIGYKGKPGENSSKWDEVSKKIGLGVWAKTVLFVVSVFGYVVLLTPYYDKIQRTNDFAMAIFGTMCVVVFAGVMAHSGALDKLKKK